MNNSDSERILFSSRDQSECKTFCKMTDADGFVREETVDIFLGMLDKSELEQLFEEETDNIRLEVISYEHVLIYFIGLL